jgi:DDE superfamily endonuclease
VFAQASSRLTAFSYIGALLAEPGDRKSRWQLAERAGHATPRRMQALLAEYAWDWKAALAALQRFIVAQLGDPEAIVVLDETAELKKGTATAGLPRQHAGITGQVENCQTVVFAAYVTARAHVLSDFRLYLPKAWCVGQARREKAHVPEEAAFTTKPALGTQMITGAADAGIPFAWVTGDEVYGRSSRLREAGEQAGKGYVLAVPVNFTVTLPSGRKAPVSTVAAMIPRTAWETRSCGRGCKGHRDYEWAWAGTALPRHWVLIRRSLSNPEDLAFYFCHAPEGRPVSLAVLIRVAGKRWPVEECFQQERPGRPRPAPSPDLAVLPPAHRVVHVRPRPTGHRRRTPATARPGCRQRARRPARSLAGHRQAARHRRRRPARQRARPGPGQRPRSTPPRPPGHPAHDHRRPPARIRLVALAPPPPGPCPLAPQPCPAQSRPGHLNPAERKEAAM